LGRRLTAAWNAEAPGKSSLERKASVSGAPTMMSRLPRRPPRSAPASPAHAFALSPAGCAAREVVIWDAAFVRRPRAESV
jgi:hypothetical protein